MKTDMKKCEEMARLSFDESERAWAQSLFENIMERLELLDGIQTDGVEALVCPSSAENILREDIPIKSELSELIIKNAPESENGLIRVPRSID